MNRDGYRDQIVTCDVGVSLHSKTHPLFMMYSNGTSTQCLCISLSKLVFCAFSTIPICPVFNSKNLSPLFFTYLKQIACLLFLLRQKRIEFPNVGGEYNP